MILSKRGSLRSSSQTGFNFNSPALKPGHANDLEFRIDMSAIYHHGIDIYGKAVVPDAEDTGIRVIIE